ncbi:hypothetical protein N9V74_03810 [Alteromonas sp.]|jgi:ABC-type Na+ efflux pump permease subunit|nr:hypothetical protein [Alteromonas sp.]
MKNTYLTLMLAAALSAVSFSPAAIADDSVNHSGEASKHSALAASEGLRTTASVASAVVAVPVLLTGSVVVAAGSAIAESAESASQSTHHSHDNAPIVITETIITADPAPNKVKVTTTTR